MKGHIEAEHGLSFETLKNSYKMDHEKYIGFVRYMRGIKYHEGESAAQETAEYLMSDNPENWRKISDGKFPWEDGHPMDVDDDGDEDYMHLLGEDFSN